MTKKRLMTLTKIIYPLVCFTLLGIAFTFSSCEDAYVTERCYDCTQTTTATAPGIEPIVNKSTYSWCGTSKEKQQLEEDKVTSTTVNGITATATTLTRCR